MAYPVNAVVFPGQGSQYLSMLEDYFIHEPVFKEVFETASKILDIDLINLIKSNSEENISKTEITQPLMLVANVALWKLVSPYLRNVSYLSGHSLGEYAALVASDALKFENALDLVKTRSKLMQNAVPEKEGAIAAVIGLTEEQVTNICHNISLDLSKLVNTANINSSNQIVISGTSQGVEKAITQCKQMGAKRAIKLKMSVPAHSELMLPASKKFTKTIEQVNFYDPHIPVIHNVDISISKSSKDIKNKLITQIYKPVRWFETIKLMTQDLGVTNIIECGPSKVLTGLIKRINPKVSTIDLDNYENYLKIKNAI